MLVQCPHAGHTLCLLHLCDLKWVSWLHCNQSIPFVKRASLNIDQHVVSKSLDGLFHVLGEEEHKIRTDPTARVTDLLKEVFSR